MTPLVNQAETVFVTELRGSGGDYKPLAPRSVNTCLEKWRVKAGIRKMSVSPHKWRHTFASEFIANGGDVSVLQELLGHLDIATKRIYIEIPKKTLRGMARKYGPKLE